MCLSNLPSTWLLPAQSVPNFSSGCVYVCEQAQAVTLGGEKKQTPQAPKTLCLLRPLNALGCCRRKAVYE